MSRSVPNDRVEAIGISPNPGGIYRIIYYWFRRYLSEGLSINDGYRHERAMIVA